jgi:hypothetical protein
MAPPSGFVLYESHADPPRVAPSAALGPWVMKPLRRVLESFEADALVLLDLRRAPLDSPREVAAVLWADDLAADLGLRLEVLAGDEPGAEVLDFVGLRAPVYSAVSGPPSRGGRLPAGARGHRPRVSAR